VLAFIEIPITWHEKYT